MRKNSLRQKLNSGEMTVGTRLYVCDPTMVEIVGQTGQFDYVEFVAEYGSFHMHDLDNFCRAAELYGMGSMFKIDQSHQWFLAQRGVGAGFESVLFTDCRSADDVRACLRTVRPIPPTTAACTVRRCAATRSPAPAARSTCRRSGTWWWR